MDEKVLLVETLGAVRIVTLHRPQRMNSLDMDLCLALRDAVKTAAEDASISVILIAGHGNNFCTGADIRRDREKEKAANIDLIDLLHEVFLNLRHGNKPSVAAVQGHVLGAGLSLMLACDFVIADTTATFGAPFTNIGLVPDIGITITLPERVGISTARDMVLCGATKGAADALSAGLIDAVCGAGQALQGAIKKAELLASRAPLATAAARSVLNMARDSIKDVLREESKKQKALRMTQDAKEAIAAFAEKRKPVFKGV